MSDKFKGKFRNESARLQNWDYGWNAAYFVTICTKDRAHFFGEIQNGAMRYSPAGAVAYVLWHEIKSHAINIELGEFVIMPNHVHGIIIIDQKNAETTDAIVGTTHALSLPPLSLPSPNNPPSENEPPQTIGQQRFQNQGKNTLSSIIGSYKSAVTKYCNRLGLPCGWQPRFHDHIIRDDQSLQRISAYIQNNPSSWSDDKFYS